MNAIPARCKPPRRLYIEPMNTTTPSSSPSIQRSRGVERVVRGQATSDGDGVKLTRVLTQPLQKRLDPFLMLDAFGSDAASDYIGGFPSHPHRGFETVTIMLEGRMRHKDSVGNVGISAPLRICLDDGTHGATPCAGTPPPSCTDSCIAPAHFQVPVVPISGYD